MNRSMKDLGFAGALEIAAHVRAGRVSAAECLAWFRGRVERFNPRLNAIVVFDWERAEARAVKADRALARGELWGPFHGVPVTVKESFDLAGQRTTWGDPALREVIAPGDDLVVQRLERAGAVVFGKTNVPLRLMDFQTYNALHGVTVNPWDASCTPGGSSGGSAAALAAGLTGLELGSDIGGSIRHPAHCCGVFGHKPTFGLVGATRGSAPGRLVATDMAVVGPMARSAADLRVAMTCLAGPGPLDGPAWRAPLPLPTKALRDHRVVVWCAEAGFDVDPEILECCRELADALARLGVTVSDHPRPDLDVGASHRLYRNLLDAAVDPFAELPRSEWLRLDDERAQVRLRWRELFQTWDAVIAPVSPVAAFRHDHGPILARTIEVNGRRVPYADLLFWPGLATVSYLPSTVFPAGRSRAGLPIGLQVIGDAWHDLAIIDFVRQVTDALGGFVPPLEYAD